MMMKKVRVTFEKVIELVVYAPADMDDATIEKVAKLQSERLDYESWDAGQWDTTVHIYRHPATLPESERALVKRTSPIGYEIEAIPAGGVFDAEEAMVINDEKDALVNPEDATWWRV
jgi:hypothetical protein